MKKVWALLLFLCLTCWVQPVLGDCEQHYFEPNLIGRLIYSNAPNLTWDFTATQNMSIVSIETLSRLKGFGTGTLTIEVLINSEQKASWSPNVTTTVTYHSHTKKVRFSLATGDTITYKISGGGTFLTPDGAIYGEENYVKLCGFPWAMFVPATTGGVKD